LTSRQCRQFWDLLAKLVIKMLILCVEILTTTPKELPVRGFGIFDI
jgi:hypothetical protein